MSINQRNSSIGIFLSNRISSAQKIPFEHFAAAHRGFVVRIVARQAPDCASGMSDIALHVRAASTAFYEATGPPINSSQMQTSFLNNFL